MKSKYYLYTEEHNILHMQTWHQYLMEQPCKYKIHWRGDIPYVISMKRDRTYNIVSTFLYTCRKDSGIGHCNVL